MSKSFRFSQCNFSTELRFRQVLRGIGICGIATLLVTAKLQQNGHLISIDTSALQSLFAHADTVAVASSSQVSTYHASNAVAVTTINNLLDGKKSQVAISAPVNDVHPLNTTLPLNWSVIKGTIRHSFSQTALQSGLTAAEINRVKTLLGEQIDFSRFKANDQFSVLLTRDASGQSEKGIRNILAIEVVQNNKALRVFQYRSSNGTISYYQANGHSLNAGFLRYPTHSTGIGSGFSNNRLDPITGHYHSHPAIDFRAPMGTPIVATGNGRINVMAYENGYGNVVRISHAGQITTVYAHMKDFAKGLQPGSPVKAGQVIGYVGMTGYATGPHVHYEYRIKGVPYNALTVKLPTAAALTGAAKQSFLNQISTYQKYL